jgi:uncharacterized membrane-anchored protein
MTAQHTLRSNPRLLNKVPQVTVWFWLVKVLCTTVGESAADFLNVNLNFGLTGTSVVTGLLLAVALAVQIGAGRYTAGRYWVAVTLISVFGTLVTDNLTDNLDVPLETSTIVFSVLLAATFIAWYASEKTLSIHSIVTRRREGFYWLAILFTFALGTATGDLMAEVLGLGYLVTGAIVAALIAALAIGWRAGLNPVLAFWFIYVLTRPLGASIGDFLSQPGDLGGLAMGATLTSVIFLVGIIVIVGYLAFSKADVITGGAARTAEPPTRGGLVQTVVVVGVVLVAGVTGYFWRTTALQDDTTQSAEPAVQSAPAGNAQGRSAAGQQPAAAAARSPLGDLSAFRVITQDTLDKLDGGDQAGATARVDDLELQWDNAEARLKPKSKAAWTDVDGKIDTVLRELRSTSPDPTSERAALSTLLAALG